MFVYERIFLIIILPDELTGTVCDSDTSSVPEDNIKYYEMCYFL
jgi:hypothetical protein